MLLRLMSGDTVVLTTASYVDNVDPDMPQRLVPNQPLNVQGRMQPLNSIERRNLGLTELTTSYKFYTAPGWQGGIHSTVVWDGREWIQQGDAMKHRGLSIKYDEVILVAVKGEVK